MDTGRLSAEDVERILAPKPTEMFFVSKAELNDVFRTLRQVFDVTYYAKPYGKDFLVDRVVAREQQAGPIAQPEPDDLTCPKALAARQAIAAEWPDGIPPALINKDIINRVQDRCRREGLSVPGERTIRDAIKGRAA